MLQDPIAGKGNANILPALKVPEFGEIAQMQSANNQLALNAAKLAADQKAKADALALAQAKAQKEAADKAKADRDKQDVAMYSLLATKPLFQLPVAQQYFADRHNQLENEARDYLDKGGTIYDKEFLPIRKKIQEYEADYLSEHENAKALTTKQETYNKNPMGFNEYDPVKDYSQNYVTHIEKKKKGEMSQFFLTSLEEYVPPTSEDVLSKRLLTDVQYGEVEKTDTKHGKAFGSNIIYPTSKISTPVAGSEGYVKDKVNYLQNTQNLTKEEIADKKGLEIMAGQYGALNQDGTIDADKFAAEIVRRKKPATTYGERTANIDKPSGGEGNGKESTGLYTNKNGYFTWGNRKDAPQINFQRENLLTPTAQVATIKKALENPKLAKSQRDYYEAQLKVGKQLNNFPVVASIKLPGNASIADAPADAFRILTNGREVKPTPEQLVKLRSKLVQTPKVIKYAASKNGNWVSQQDWGEGNNELNSPNVDGFTGRIVTTTDDGEIVTINPIALGIEEKDYPQGFDQNFIANQYGQQVQQPQPPQNKTAPKKGKLSNNNEPE